jgi:hypothetical protein
MEEQKNLEMLREEMRALLADKGDFRASYKNELRGQERQYGMDLDRLGIEAAAFNAELQGGRADQRRENQDFKAQYGISRKKVLDGISPEEAKRMRQHQKAMGGGSGSGGGGSTGDDPDKYYGMGRKWWKNASPAERLDARKRWEAAGRGEPSPPKKDTAAADRRRENRREKRERTNEVLSRVETAIDEFKYYRKNPFDPDDDPETENTQEDGATKRQALDLLRGTGDGKFTADELKVAMGILRWRKGNGTFKPAQIEAAKRLGIKLPAKYRNYPGGADEFPVSNNSDGMGPK